MRALSRQLSSSKLDHTTIAFGSGSGTTAVPNRSPGRSVTVTVGPDQTHELRALVGTNQRLPPGASIPLTFRITDVASGRQASTSDHFRGP